MTYKRLLEKRIREYLSSTGVLCVTGSRFVGKSFTSELFAKKIYNLFDEPKSSEIYQFPQEYLMKTKIKPIMIDEWQLKPELWNIAKTVIDKKINLGYLFSQDQFELIKIN